MEVGRAGQRASGAIKDGRWPVGWGRESGGSASSLKRLYAFDTGLIAYRYMRMRPATT